MSLIEGIGDEVMVLAAFLVVATTLLAAWFSTHVGERPGPQVQVIQTTITHIRGGQQSSGSTTVAAGSSGIDEGGGGEDRTIDTSASDDTQESDAVRSTNRVESTEQSFDESISGAGAQSQTDSLSRTGDQTVHADDTDSSLKVQSDNISNEKKSKEQDGKTVEETNSRPEEESSSTSYVENQRTSDDQNVLRNRNTGQVYPTLPSYSSDGGTHEEEVASGGISAGASSVEDIGRTDGDDEETSHTAEGRICIRVKFSHEDERLIQTRPEETLGQFRRYEKRVMDNSYYLFLQLLYVQGSSYLSFDIPTAQNKDIIDLTWTRIGG